MALDPNKKFLYFNEDDSIGEMNSALCFPVSSFIGAEIQTTSVIYFYFEGSKGTDATIIQLQKSLTTWKAILISLVDEINYGDKAFIRVYDRGQRGTNPSDVSFALDGDYTLTATLQDAEFDVGGDLRVNGKLSFDGIGGVSAVDYNTAFNDSDIRLMTSKAINNRFAQINADTTGNAATATLAADATTLATPRAIFGHDFDGSAALTGVIASANLDSDTAHLSTTQTFTGAKTFSSSLTASGLAIINNRLYQLSGASAGDHDGGDVVYFGGTTGMTAGTIYHYKSDATWEVADANDVTKCDGLLAVALGAASNTNGMLLRGMVTLDHDPGSVGDVLYLSNTAGDASASAPSDNNDIVRIVGYCLGATNNKIWFNPDNTYVEVTA